MDSEAPPKKARLILEHGQVFHCFSFGAEVSLSGECVFQTGMVGYPESLTDPSYYGQILIMSYPLVGNYGVPSEFDVDEHKLPKYFESDKIHVKALIVADNSAKYSHWNAKQSLSDWLKKYGVPGLHGVDTRALIKLIREKGSCLGKIVFEGTSESSVVFNDPNKFNLVAAVSTKEIKVYGNGDKEIIMVDVGIKYNQIRCFLQRGVKVKVVPWNYDFATEYMNGKCDGLFISNGPGDPMTCDKTIENLRKVFEFGKSTTDPSKIKPVFGICMGNLLFGLAAGAKTYKLKYGNRGHNQPCIDQTTKRCYLTVQNHGYAIDTNTLPNDWQIYFTNANDFTNEGIRHKSRPYFSVQFHPEAKPGPEETSYLFDMFLSMVRGTKFDMAIAREFTPEKPQVKKVLILGSGGLSIGQAGEFDYSGSQAIKALKEEKIETVLINPNIATVQTSPGLADKVYFLPVTPDYVIKVMEKERPDGILATFGGQTALNCAVELHKRGAFQKYGVKVLGTPVQAIMDTEDRQLFSKRLAEINESVAAAGAATSVEEAITVAEMIGYPVIVRAAYTLGGLGSGFADNKEQLVDIVRKALATSEQVLIELSMKGWKEIEYEVVRDAFDNCVTVCNMENFDPLGIHTGESIVVAPSQTLSNSEYQMLRNVAIKVVRHLGIVGECNIQFALNPDSERYCIIEVNARLSRSSALASKATGYPLAFVSAKLSLGFSLPELRNAVTKVTTACFEPSLDYIVVKMPLWDLGKFDRVSKKINSSMKSVGEIMAIGRTYEEAIQKAIRMANPAADGFSSHYEHPALVSQSIEDALQFPDDKRIYTLARALKQGYSVEKIHELTKIDMWFLHKLKAIIELEKTLNGYTHINVPHDLLKTAKEMGFSDKQIAVCTTSTEIAVRQRRKALKILPVVKQIDTVAAEFPAQNNYLFITYNGTENDISFNDKGLMVLGSGGYRIGSSVEFDWCAVGCVRAIHKLGYRSVMVNCNPETVSTDYDECNRLYFEELTLERVLDIYEQEQSLGVIISVGGQIPNNLAMPLYRQNVNILGTNPEMIDTAENRYKFSRLLDTMGVTQPRWTQLTNVEEAAQFCEMVEYPCLVRPSYVLSGASMKVVYNQEDLQKYLKDAAEVSKDHPVVISKFISRAKEIELDGVSFQGKLVAKAISEHVENAGVHSGDATLVCPAQDLDIQTVTQIEDFGRKIAAALNVSGPFNIQFIAKDNEIKVIECNVRTSRSLPFVSKTLKIDFIDLATKAILEKSEYFQDPSRALQNPTVDYVGVKVPQFSFTRLQGADPVSSVEMASTGEVACFGKSRDEAYLKALLSTGFKLPKKNILLSIGSFYEKQEFLESTRKLVKLGYSLFGTPGTADFLQENDVAITVLAWTEEENEDSIANYLKNNKIHLFINLPSKNKYRRPSSFMSPGYLSRRLAVDLAVPLITNIKCAKLFVDALAFVNKLDICPYDCHSSAKLVKLPGLIDLHVHMREPGGAHKEDWESGTAAALAGGFTIVAAMPNTNPAITDENAFALVSKLATQKALCDYTLYVGASNNNASTLPHIAKLSAALKMYLDPTFTTLQLTDMTVWMEHLKHWPSHMPIVVHAEKRNFAAILSIAIMFDKAIHVAHVTSREELDLIRIAKQKGHKVTCEVTPHHLFLSQDDLRTLGENRGKVAPKLITKSEQDYLWNNLDVIDCFATDHAPHTLEEKDSDSPPPGFPGLETALPLLLTAVSEGRLTLDDIIARCYTNPRKIFNFPEQRDTYIEIDLDKEWIIPPAMQYSKCKWTPFAGKRVKGMVKKVVLRSETVYMDGKIFTLPGYGKDLRRISKDFTIPDSIPMSPQMSPLNASPDGREQSPSKAIKMTSSKVEVFPTLPIASSVVLPPAPSINIISTAASGTHPIELGITGAHIKTNWSSKSILSVSQFTHEDLRVLFNTAMDMKLIVKKLGSYDVLKGKIMGTLFYEPSTRTCSSFTAAMQRLGGSVISVNESTSSVAKGESLPDTVRTIERYVDIIVIRHPGAGSAAIAAKYAVKPVINGGDGIGEHPTQALLDVFTIREELGTVNGLNITLLGDLKHGRTAHSLVRLLALYKVQLTYISPESLKLPAEIKAELSQRGIPQKEASNLEDILPTTDVLYVTRIQKERFATLQEYEAVKGSYVITPKTLTLAKDRMVVMHPLPRVDEISPEVDTDPRAAYFRQMENGMYVRMALLALILGKP